MCFKAWQPPCGIREKLGKRWNDQMTSYPRLVELVALRHVTIPAFPYVKKCICKVVCDLSLQGLCFVTQIKQIKCLHFLNLHPLAMRKIIAFNIVIFKETLNLFVNLEKLRNF